MCPWFYYTRRWAVHSLCLHTLHTRVKPHAPADAEIQHLCRGLCLSGLRTCCAWVRGQRLEVPVPVEVTVPAEASWSPAQSHAERGSMASGENREAGRGRHGQVGAALLSPLCALTWLCCRKGPAPQTQSWPCLPRSQGLSCPVLCSCTLRSGGGPSAQHPGSTPHHVERTLKTTR